jgi:alpha-D-ribose 1-methylphosphonate 5-triphosphate synthase subunit PhnH
MPSATAITADWQNPVSFSAKAFRLILDSMARPGKINRLELPELGQYPPVNPYATGVLLTLLDSEVSFAIAVHGQWLAAKHPTVEWFKLRSGAQAVEAAKAHFALFCDGNSQGKLLELNRGTLLEPENSATVIYCVEKLTAFDAPPNSLSLKLNGAGIEGTKLLAVQGLAQSELELFRQTRQAYPLGIDVYLIDQTGGCVGLPRTTKISLNTEV